MSITMLQHFNYPETLTYEGNAELSNASKFGKACAHFKNSTSTVSLTNTTGVFNLSTSGSVEAECFVKTIASGGNNTGMDTPMIEELLANGYYMYDGHVFKRYDESKTWTDAKLYCEAIGGHLATITNAEKQAFIDTFASNNNRYWIGGQKINDTWTWITGETWNYTNWDSDAPYNYVDFMVIHYHHEHWQDYPTNLSIGFICEWDTVLKAYASYKGYRFYDGHTFKLFETNLAWTRAEELCETFGGHLVTITSAEKANFVEIAKKAESGYGDTWLGGYREAGVFKWVTGEEWSYTNWAYGEPSDSDLWIHIYAQYGNDWYATISTTENCYAMCEWDYDLFSREHSENSFIASGWQFYKGHSFKQIDFGSDGNKHVLWAGAKTACEALGGHLATITSREKEYYLISLQGFQRHGSLTGGHKVNDVWEWVTGEEWNYTNWYSGEPSSTNLYAKLNGCGQWNTTNNNYLERYCLCEWDEDIRDNPKTYLTVAGYSFYNGHTFKYYSDTKTWTDAKAFCEELGGHLATSTSAEKNTFLTTLTTDSAWIGGTDEAEEGVWQWVTGEEWNYTNWASGQPDNANSAEHYLEINFGGDAVGTWNDISSSTTLCYICEWDYDFRENGSGVSSGNILCLSDNSNVVAASDAETQGYKFLNAHTYQLITTGATQNAARIACEALGGHLAVVNSREEFDFLCNWVGNTRTWVEGTKGTTADISNVHISDGVYMDYSSYPFAGAGWGTALFIFNSGYFADEAPDSPTYQYICEWDYDIREPKALTLSIANGGALSLQSAIWGLNETSTLTLEADTWYHILLRLSEGTASVYLNGVQALSGNVSGADITPQALTLGGYKGYMDEFVFRDEAGTGAPVVPTSAYETGTGTVATSNNAPVTRAVWTCEDLPEGLTLSSSGVLSGHPTTAGTYNCDVSVATNWGTATKTINITVA